MITPPPLSLYIHFPWCEKKCPYCDFHSLPQTQLPENQYVSACINQAKQLQPYVKGRAIQTIFMGGGTPSLMSAAQISRLLDALAKIYTFSDTIEITLEANPSSIEADKFAGFRAGGVNRLSIGVQSFSDEKLQALGRVHDSKQAKQAIITAADAGFDNMNIDLMFGLPKQSIAQGLDDLKTAIDFAPKHLSWYQLTLEPNTRFYSRPPKLPSNDDIATLHDQGQAMLAQHDYSQYEVSAYSRQAPCQHNLNYWQFGDYLAIGSGAHGKITHNNQVWRYQNQINPNYYMALNHAFMQKCYTVDPNQLPFEFMLNSLRLKQGVPAEFYQRTGLPRQSILQKVAKLHQRELMIAPDTRLQTTPLGFRFINDCLNEFMEEDHANN